MNLNSLHGPYKHVFMTGEEINEALSAMEEDDCLNTKPSFVKGSASSIQLVSFREKHLGYLKEHPKINPEHYLANLRAMIKIRA